MTDTQIKNNWRELIYHFNFKNYFKIKTNRKRTCEKYDFFSHILRFKLNIRLCLHFTFSVNCNFVNFEAMLFSQSYGEISNKQIVGNVAWNFQ